MKHIIFALAITSLGLTTITKNCSAAPQTTHPHWLLETSVKKSEKEHTRLHGYNIKKIVDKHNVTKIVIEHKYDKKIHFIDLSYFETIHINRPLKDLSMGKDILDQARDAAKKILKQK